MGHRRTQGAGPELFLPNLGQQRAAYQWQPDGEVSSGMNGPPADWIERKARVDPRIDYERKVCPACHNTNIRFYRRGAIAGCTHCGWRGLSVELVKREPPPAPKANKPKGERAKPRTVPEWRPLTHYNLYALRDVAMKAGGRR